MTVDVVVVTWRGRELLRSCLEHLRAQTLAHRVIVVDNASDDGTVELVRARFGEVTLLELPENVGFGRAVNAGVAAGDGDAVVLVNNDVDLEPGALAALVAPLEVARVGMVAGLTLQPGPEDVVDGFGIALDRGLCAYNRLRHRAVAELPERLAVPSGGLAAYRRRAFTAAGGLDAALFAYGEDVDLGLRMRRAGWAVAAASGARGTHLGGATTGVDSPAQRRLAGFARGFVLRRYGVLRSRGALHALAVDGLVVVWGVVRWRTAVPLTARVAGWRAAGRGSLRLPTDVVDEAITLGRALRALCDAR